MAMFNSFPATYQNPYYSMQNSVTQSMPTQQMSQANGSIIWVQGEAGAKSYLVAPNSTVQLWDSEEQVIYLKSADASGMPSMKILDYTIRGTETPMNAINNADNNYISKDELRAIQGEIDALKDEIKRLKPKKKKEVEEDDE